MRGHSQNQGRWGGGFLEKTILRPLLWGRPFAGLHTLGIIRIYVCSSIPPHPLLCCRPISGPKGSPERDSSLSAFDQNELCLLDSLWHFISPLCPPSLSVQHWEWNVQDRVHILLYACCHARTVGGRSRGRHRSIAPLITAHISAHFFLKTAQCLLC